MKQKFKRLVAKVLHSIYFLIIFTFLISSCKPLSKLGNNNLQIESISKEDYRKLNGTYSNNFDTTFGKINHSPYDGLCDFERLNILDQLFLNYPETAWRDKNDSMINPKNKWIKIEFQSKKQAIISMYNNDEFVFSKRIHGKIKNGYFILRPKDYILPFIPLVFGYNFERAKIGMEIGGNLIIDYTVNKFVFTLLGGSAENGYSESIYKKKIF